MLDYVVLKVIWWMILGCILVVYAATSGFDAGVTLIMPFLKNEEQRRVALNTSAPTWDGNLTWIVFAGGGLFVVWPVVYSTAFSGMYAAMLFVLYTLFLRPPGYEYRNKIPSHRWRRMWDVALFISSFMPVFIFGVMFGNCFLGFPFYFDPLTMRQFYTGNFFQLFSGFGLLAGIMSVLMVAMHGAAYLQRRTEDALHRLAKKLHYIFGTLLIIGFTLAGYLVIYHIKGYTLVSSPSHPTLEPLKNVVTQEVGAWIVSYEKYPWKFFGPLGAYIALFVSFWANYHNWRVLCFWASVLTVGGVLATAGFTLFPFIMPSSINPAQSLTVWNAVSSQYALNIMLYVGVVLLMIILAYKVFAYHSVWSEKSTLTVEDLRENEHTFY